MVELTNIGLPTVPPVDSALNRSFVDVIGNKNDTDAGDSLYALLTDVKEHTHCVELVYPTLANGATVVSAAADWTLGAYATIVPASTITSDFHIHGVSLESMDKNAVFQLEIYYGAADVLVTQVRFAVQGGFFGNSFYRIASIEVPADSRIRARLASSDGLANQATATIAIAYAEE